MKSHLYQQSWGHSITSSESTSNHHTVQHSDEEDLRIEKRAKGVNESIPALAPIHLAMEESNVVAERSGTTLVTDLIARNAI
ncbi:hypothetical protein CaCOL14_005875 [Colletotrichum acutatum]